MSETCLTREPGFPGRAARTGTWKSVRASAAVTRRKSFFAPRVLLTLLFVSFLTLAPTATLAATISDGPYVSVGPKGDWTARWVEGDAAAPRVVTRAVRKGQSVTVPAVGARPSFEVRLRGEERVARNEVRLRPNEKVFVIADTHGEFEIATELLLRHKILSDTLDWSFGRGHLVILGDVFDRGAHQTEILWLIYKLESQAKTAGGAVHLLLGNHETMVLLGDRRYLNEKYLRTTAALGAPTYASLWGQDSLLGRWLRTKPGVQRIGDNLCLHGGISAELLSRRLTLAAINETIRDTLVHTPPYGGASDRYKLDELSVLGSNASATDADRERAKFLTFASLGPLWYRGYFAEAARDTGMPVATDHDVAGTLDLFGVKRILVGHTVVPTVTSLYEGKVIAVQVYPRKDEESGTPIAEGLRIEKGRLFRAKIDGTLEPM